MFYYGSTAGSTESYTFTLDCVANGIPNTLSFNGQLSNTAPTMDTQNNVGTVVLNTSSYTNMTVSAANLNSGIVPNLLDFTVVNGSADTNRKRNEISVIVVNSFNNSETPIRVTLDNTNGSTGITGDSWHYYVHPIPYLLSPATYDFKVKLYDATSSGPLSGAGNNQLSEYLWRLIVT